MLAFGAWQAPSWGSHFSWNALRARCPGVTCVPWGAFDAITRRAWEARESIQPVTPWDAVVTFQARHTWDTWLSPLTFRGDCSRISLQSLGPRRSSVTRGPLEPREPRDAMLTRVSLAPFLPGFPIEAWEALGSWEPRNTPDELIIFCTFTVASVTFPALLPARPREAGESRVACPAIRSLQAEEETVWSGRSGRPRGSPQPWCSVSSRWARVQRREARFSYEAFGSHFALEASLLIFPSDGRARGAWWAGVSWFTPAAWLPVGPWESRITSGTFPQGGMRRVGRWSCGTRVTRFSLGSWVSVRALVTIQAFASFLSW